MLLVFAAYYLSNVTHAGGGTAGEINPSTDSGHFLALNYCCSLAYGLALIFKK